MKYAPRTEIGWALCLLFLVAASYVGSYYALVVTPPPHPWNSSRCIAFAEYRLGGRFTETLFAPMHAIDLRIRPSAWETYYVWRRLQELRRNDP